jgi:hypothetical protein
MTMPQRRQTDAARSGGRTTLGRAATTTAYPTAGNAALQPAPRAPQERAPRLRVAPPAPVAAPRAPFVLLVLTLVVSGVIGVLVLNTKINENAFRLQELQRRQSALTAQEQQLAEDLAQKESPGSLAAAARRLGLVPAGTPAFIQLPDGRVLGVPQPAAGQPSNSGTGQPGGAAPGQPSG